MRRKTLGVAVAVILLTCPAWAPALIAWFVSR